MGRFIIMILDGVGVGALPDAEEYGDVGSNTLGNLAEFVHLRVPNLTSLGIGNILPPEGGPSDAGAHCAPGPPQREVGG